MALGLCKVGDNMQSVKIQNQDQDKDPQNQVLYTGPD